MHFTGNRSVLAGGTVYVGRIVKADGTVVGGGVQVSAATDVPIGIASMDENGPPGVAGTTDNVAATTGQYFRIHRNTEECLVHLGATVAANALVMADSSGRAITYSSTSGNWIVGQVLEGGAVGEYVRMIVGIQKLN
jgi:hypothetical protein